MVREYQLVRLNISGLIDIADRCRFADDGAAMARASEMAHTSRVEVWAGKQRVGVVFPVSARRSTAAGR